MNGNMQGGGTVAAIGSALLFAALATSPAAYAGDAPASAGDKVVFRASVKVDVDAAGHPVKVEAPRDLPPDVRAVIERRVSSWHYQPAKIGGTTQTATTYVQVSVCAVPMAEGYRLGVDFDHNGFRFANGVATAPNYPSGARRDGAEAELVMMFNVDEEGRARIDSIETVQVSGFGATTQFEQELRRWVHTLRFDPELVAGKPVAGTGRMPVFFIFQGGEIWARTEGRAWEEAQGSRECAMASGTHDSRPVAMQPAVSVTPVPAS